MKEVKDVIGMGAVCDCEGKERIIGVVRASPAAARKNAIKAQYCRH